MSDHLDRAAAIVGGCCAHCDDLVDERLALLDEAGLLASPEHDAAVRAEIERLRAGLEALDGEVGLPLHRTEAGYPNCSTCDGGGCLDCTDPA